VRYTYNWALRLSVDIYQQTGQGLSYKQMSVQLTTLKHQAEAAFLNEVSCVPLQQGLRHLKRAYVNFFEGRANLRGVRTSLSSRSDTMRNLRNAPA
jgi:putative transposase